MNTLKNIRLAAATESATNSVLFAIQLAFAATAGVSVAAVAKALLDAISI